MKIHKNTIPAPRALEAQRPMQRASRREVLRLLAGVGLLPLVPVLGCGGTGSVPDSGGTSPDGGGTSPDGGGASPDGAAAGGWASGGTAAMTGKASYPDPFTGVIGACALVASTTEGPCTTASDLLRADVSEGLPGLPVRLALKVVDTSCQPLAGASVKIWHTNVEGSYSGQTPNNNMCLKQQAYSAANFFRGVQQTAADGTVSFDTCFPGWYRGRAVHVHFQVKRGTTSYRVSQLFFPEDVTQTIFASHGDYRGYGQPDTVFGNDNILSGIPTASRDRHVLTVARMTDGAMLASKVVTVA